MKGILLPQGGGKTTALIKMSAENGGYIVCHSQDECSRIFAEAKEMNLKINFPMTYEEFIGDYGRIKEFYIDNADRLLQFLSRVPIKTFTISSELFED